VESAVQVTKTLQNIINKPLSTKTVYYYLKKAGIEAVIKKKMLHLTKHYRRERLNFEISYKNWTVENWKRVVWSNRTKVNYLGQMEGNGLGKRQERVSVADKLKKY
jgi:hypothetical protein